MNQLLKSCKSTLKTRQKFNKLTFSLIISTIFRFGVKIEAFRGAEFWESHSGVGYQEQKRRNYKNRQFYCLEADRTKNPPRWNTEGKNWTGEVDIEPRQSPEARPRKRRGRLWKELKRHNNASGGLESQVIGHFRWVQEGNLPPQRPSRRLRRTLPPMRAPDLGARGGEGREERGRAGWWGDQSG